MPCDTLLSEARYIFHKKESNLKSVQHDYTYATTERFGLQNEGLATKMYSQIF